MIMLKLVFRNQTKSVRLGFKAQPNGFRALASRASRLFPKQTAGKTVSLVFVAERESKRLNKLYRRKSRPTNVLSFASGAADELGDIIICPARVAREAAAAGLGFNERVAELFVHGLLHLLGFSHAKGPAEKKMEQAADKILPGKIL